ncbi:prepilin-type N-terminal cleavage/methylation domain-containing protein [Candidatus Woesebacteria bacterium]|nr:prepilin-type N-terminal cleavage/methylation domain-containing protein [Candidatus Woesebacteria bacterium]
MKTRFSVTQSGFTLIELMIAVTIITIMVSFGFSAYGKARERQVGVSAGEQIITLLQSNLTQALVGNKDCQGKYLSQELVITPPGTFSSTSQCEGDDGITMTTIIPDIVLANSATLNFNPLTKGINLQNGATELLLNYTTPSGISYQIKVNNSGTIEYLGPQ